MRKTSRYLAAAAFIAVVMMTSVAPAQASSLTFQLNQVFSGFTPVGPTPWATVTFRDLGDCSGAPCAAGTVQMVVTASLTSGQFITEWDFNTSVALTSFVYTSTLSGSFNTNFGCGNDSCILPYSSNNYQADGDGLYDFGLDFDSGPPSDRFDGTDSALFTLQGSGLTAGSFNSLSAPGGNAGGPFHTAAHVQGIPGGCSGWVADSAAGSGTGTDQQGPCGTSVPEPTSLLLLGSGLAGLAAAWRLRRS